MKTHLIEYVLLPWDESHILTAHTHCGRDVGFKNAVKQREKVTCKACEKTKFYRRHDYLFEGEK